MIEPLGKRVSPIGSHTARSSSRRSFLASGLAASSLITIASCTTRHSPDASVTSIEHYLRGTPDPEQPVLDFAVATDPAFAGGADPSATRDSTESIRAAVNSGKPVYLPPGGYLFSGPGLDSRAPYIVGAGQGATTISMADNAVFIDSNQLWERLTLRGIRFDGGWGHVRNRYNEVNVTDYHTVTDCAFIDYSGTSISTHSVDHPYWKIERNIFRADNYRTSMAVSLPGLTDGTTIADNAFLANRVHLKLGRGGNNTYIHNCDFLRFAPPQGFPRIDVWFTLTKDDIDCGSGMVITRCKFGNEFLAPTDLRIVYADELVYAEENLRWPQLDAASPNWVGGHTVSNVFANGIGDESPIPLIRSTTSNIVGSTYGPVTVAGSSGAPLVSSIFPLRDGGISNYFGPMLRANSYTSPLPPLVVSDKR